MKRIVYQVEKITEEIKGLFESQETDMVSYIVSSLDTVNLGESINEVKVKGAHIINPVHLPKSLSNHMLAVLEAIDVGADLVVLHNEYGGIYAGAVDEYDEDFLLSNVSYADIVLTPLTSIDTAAVELARVNHLPIFVTDTSKIGNLKLILNGKGYNSEYEHIGTYISDREFGEYR